MTGIAAAVGQGVIEGRCRFPVGWRVTGRADVGRAEMRAGFARDVRKTRRMGTVVAREAGARDKSVIHVRWRPGGCIMAALAGVLDRMWVRLLPLASVPLWQVKHDVEAVASPWSNVTSGVHAVVEWQD